jgi:acyl-CoA-binding protein
MWEGGGLSLLFLFSLVGKKAVGEGESPKPTALERETRRGREMWEGLKRELGLLEDRQSAV